MADLYAHHNQTHTISMNNLAIFCTVSLIILIVTATILIISGVIK
jgi:hypothetical protein